MRHTDFFNVHFVPLFWTVRLDKLHFKVPGNLVEALESNANGGRRLDALLMFFMPAIRFARTLQVV